MPPKELDKQTLQQKIQSDIDALDVGELRVLKNDGLRTCIVVNCFVPGTLAGTAGNYTSPCFISDRNYQVISVVERHNVAGTDAGAVTVDVKKAASGTDIGSGTSLISATFSLKATADTNQTGAVVSGMTISTGQAIGLLSSGTLTDVSGVCVTIKLRGL